MKSTLIRATLASATLVLVTAGPAFAQSYGQPDPTVVSVVPFTTTTTTIAPTTTTAPATTTTTAAPAATTTAAPTTAAPSSSVPATKPAGNGGGGTGTNQVSFTPDKVTVSQPDPSTPAKVRVTVGGFKPGSSVSIAGDGTSYPLGTFTADAAGNVDVEVVLPASFTGSHTLTASGTAADGTPLVRTQALDVQAAGSGSDAAPGILAFTGNNARGMAALGGVLLTIGVAATVAARKRLGDEA
jgi:hypothetical protein